MRSSLALLAPVLVFTACQSPSPATLAADNRVVIDVRCNAKEVTVTVDPFQAHALAREPMEWHIKGGAHVSELEISSTAAGNWPFTEPLPYRSTPGRPASAATRVNGWPSGTNAHYKITGVCRSPGGAIHPFVIDPDMIVD